MRATNMVRVLCILAFCCVPAMSNAFADENPDYVNAVQRAHVQYRAGQFAAAETSLVTALRMLQRDDDVHRAATLADLGDVYMNEDELSKAEQAYSESLRINRRLSDTKNTVLILRNLGSLYSIEGRGDDALDLLRQALKLVKASSDPSPALTAHLLNSFGVVYCRKGQFGKAEDFFKQALQVASKSSEPFDTPQLLHNLGIVYYEKRAFTKAEDFFKRALKFNEAEIGPSHPDLTFSLSSLGTLYTEMKRYSEAEQQYQRALTILRTGEADFDTRIARLLLGLSVTYTKSGQKPEANAAISEAAMLARRNLSGHPDMAGILEAYSVSLNHQGKVREAEELRSEVKRARIAAGLVIHAHNAF